MSEQEQDRSKPATGLTRVVLAAVERAERHRASAGPPGVTLAEVLAHLATPRRSPAARAIRAALAVLEREGALTPGGRGAVPVWGLSPRGRRRLAAAGAGVRLPESPQHRAWRETRELARSELPALRAGLQAALTDASAALAGPSQGAADVWLELAERLRAHARALGCAMHCLEDWPEPDDARADVDHLGSAQEEDLDAGARARLRALRSGRRNPRTWL